MTTALMVAGEHPVYQSPQNGRAWIVGLDSKAIASICRPLFEEYMPSRYKINGKWNGKNEMWFLESDGRKWEVWFKSVDSGRQKFQGDKLDFAWIDEEPLKEGVFTELETRLTDKGGIWLLTATPVEGTRWLKETMERDDVYSTMAGMRENPYIPIEEVESLARQLSEDERAVRIEGKYITFGGRPVFDRRAIADMEGRVAQFQQGTLLSV